MSKSQHFTKLSAFCKDVGHCNLQENTYYTCASFLFYTAWFEEKLFANEKGKRQCPSTSKIIADQLAPRLDLTQYDEYGNYFVQRYLNDPKAADYRHALQFSDIEKLKSVLIEFRDKQTRNSDLLWTYLMIAYRFRNNMFHGSKGLINLNAYKEQFDLLNQFWDQLLRDIDSLKYYGFNTDKK